MDPNTQEEDLVRADKYGWKLLVIGLLLIGGFFGFWIGRGTAPKEEVIKETRVLYLASSSVDALMQNMIK